MRLLKEPLNRKTYSAPTSFTWGTQLGHSKMTTFLPLNCFPKKPPKIPSSWLPNFDRLGVALKKLDTLNHNNEILSCFLKKQKGNVRPQRAGKLAGNERSEMEGVVCVCPSTQTD